MDEYKTGLVQMLGSACLQKARDIVAKKIKFDGLHDAGLGLEGFKMHHTLLDIYEKVQHAKRSL